MTTAPAPTTTVATMAPAMRDTTAHGDRHGYTAADVRFMQHMIAHHAQALAMTGLVQSRTGRDDVRLIAQRITASQTTEIAMMQRWLRERGEVVPNASADAMAHDMAAHHMSPSGMAMAADSGHGMNGHDMPMAGMLMPGMLTPAQMDALARSTGADFDRLFLNGMIQHHEGALRMVSGLFSQPGAGQDSEIFRFANDVDTDQRAEIARMQALLGALPDSAQHR